MFKFIRFLTPTGWVVAVTVTAVIVLVCGPAKAAEWRQSSDHFVCAEMTQAEEELPLPMPPAMLATVASVHRHFGINFPDQPDKKEVLVFLADNLPKEESDGSMATSEIIRFNLALEGLQSFMAEAKKRKVSLEGLDFGLEPDLSAGRIRDSGAIHRRLEGDFADRKWRKLMLTALGGETKKK